MMISLDSSEQMSNHQNVDWKVCHLGAIIITIVDQICVCGSVITKHVTSLSVYGQQQVNQALTNMKCGNVYMWHSANQVHFTWSQTKVKHYWFNKVIEELFRRPNQCENSENSARELDFCRIFLLCIFYKTFILMFLLTFCMSEILIREKEFSFHCMFCSLLMCVSVFCVCCVNHLNG